MRWTYAEGMADDALIAVTAATGGLGGRVARRLAAAGAAQRLVVRDPDRAPALPGANVAQARYDDPGTVRAALGGVDTLLFVSATEHPDRVGLHRGAIDAAIQAGVRRIVYTSFLAAAADATFTFARDHWHTEQHIRATGVPFTFLRDSLYQDVLPYFVGGDGAIRGPAGEGRFAPVAPDPRHGPADPLPRGDARRGVRLTVALRRAAVGGRRLGHDIRGDRHRRAGPRHRHGVGGGRPSVDELRAVPRRQPGDAGPPPRLTRSCRWP
jgi:uncharacterized protein YbjT (DUF2867 family)